MAILLLLFALFALLGVGSGSSGTSSAQAPAQSAPPVLQQSSSRSRATCEKVRIESAFGQSSRCIYIPVGK